MRLLIIPSTDHCTILLVYGTEKYVGDAIRESGLARSEIYVTTKYSGIGSPEHALDNSLDKVSPV